MIRCIEPYTASTEGEVVVGVEFLDSRDLVAGRAAIGVCARARHPKCDSKVGRIALRDDKAIALNG